MLAYLLFSVFDAHGHPYLRTGDQMYFWDYALRLSQGDHVYRDFFQFTPPGADLYYLAFLKTFGITVRAVALGVVIMGMGLLWACYSVGRCFLSRFQAAFWSTVVVVLIFADRLDGTHHWLSLIASLCAVRVLMRSRTTARIVAAGVLAGVASFITQTSGAAVLLAISLSLVWEKLAKAKDDHRFPSRLAVFLGSAGLTWLVCMLPFLVDAGWRQLRYLLIVYPNRYVVDGTRFLLPNFASILHGHGWLLLARRIFIYLAPFVCLCSLGFLWRRRKEDTEAADLPLIMPAMLGVMLFASVMTRMNWTRSYAVAVPGVLLLAWILSRTHPWVRRCAAVASACLMATALASQMHERSRENYGLVNLPAGNIEVPAARREEFLWLRDHLHPGDFMVQTGWLDLYLPLQTRDPIFAENLLPGERTRPEFVDLAVQQIEARRVTYIVWNPSPVSSGNSELGNLPADHLQPLRDDLNLHYFRQTTFENGDEVWKRRENRD